MPPSDLMSLFLAPVTGIRRAASLLLYVLLLTAGLSTASAADQAARTLIGYAAPLTVRPGDTVAFKVSSFKGAYQADLVQVINGDSLSRYKDMFKVLPVNAKFAGKYDGIEQPLNLGSYVHVDDAGALDGLASFTVGAWIYPTFDPTEYEAPDLENPDPFYPPTLSIAPLTLDQGQTIISRFDKTTGTGWAGASCTSVVTAGSGVSVATRACRASWRVATSATSPTAT